MDQDVCLFSRKRMELTGVSEVESFSDSEIVLLSQLGRIVIGGGDLKIGRFSAEDGKLTVTGTVDSFTYEGEGEEEEKKGFFQRLFR